VIALVQSSCLETAYSNPSTQGFEFEKEETVRFIERAVEQIARRDSVEAALRELEAFLLHTLGLVKRDPGLEIAAYDLYAAAAVIVASRSADASVVDVRPWRLLSDAARRFGERVQAAIPRVQAPEAPSVRCGEGRRNTTSTEPTSRSA
jgi:hypothetical protein